MAAMRLASLGSGPLGMRRGKVIQHTMASRTSNLTYRKGCPPRPRLRCRLSVGILAHDQSVAELEQIAAANQLTPGAGRAAKSPCHHGPIGDEANLAGLGYAV